MNYNRRLTLACIVGNVRPVIIRFLESFAPLADEVVLVQAIGDATDDGTMQLAEKWLRANKVKRKLSVYHNKGEIRIKLDEPVGFCDYFVQCDTSTWPHVDDFAAARQTAFDLATHSWVMWADTDDIFNPAFIPIVRNALDNLPDGTVGIQFPYEVPEDRLTVMRERIVRKDSFRWHSPIHECLMPLRDDVNMGSLNNVKIVHMPIAERKPHDERNLRILESIPKPMLTRSQKFHLVQSLSAVGRKTEAAVLAVETLQSDGEMEPPERMQLLFTASEAAPPEVRSQLMLQAAALDPSRREAFGELVLNALQRQKPVEMLGWARAMKAQPMPKDLPWNAQRRYWGWLGVQLEGMALRFNGDTAGADARELNHFLANGGKISLLHATRGRPVQASRARKMWLDRAENGDAIEHIFAIDADDELVLATLSVFRHVVVQPGGGCVRAWNQAAEASRGRVLIQLSDDWEPPMHWDKLILERLGDLNEPKVLAVSDGHRTDDLLCMAILTRARYLDQSYMFHPDFLSMYSDNWFSESAHRDGVVIKASDLVFEHLHPVFNKSEMDETYAVSNDASRYRQGEAVLKRLQNGIITSHDAEGWCDYRDLYSAIAKALPDCAQVAEVGVWKGQSVIHLAQRLQDAGKRAIINAIDTFEGDGETGKQKIFPEFAGNITKAGVDDMVNPMVWDSLGASARFKDGELDFVFIDAAHDYDSVYCDLKAWRPKVKATGIFAGHDADAPGVQKALADAGIKYQMVGRCWVAVNEELKNDLAHGAAGGGNQPQTH